MGRFAGPLECCDDTSRAPATCSAEPEVCELRDGMHCYPLTTLSAVARRKCPSMWGGVRPFIWARSPPGAVLPGSVAASSWKLVASRRNEALYFSRSAAARCLRTAGRNRIAQQHKIGGKALAPVELESGLVGAENVENQLVDASLS